MAVTLSNIYRGITADGKRFAEADVAHSNPYVSGGEVVTLATLGLTKVTRVEIIAGFEALAGVTPNKTAGTFGVGEPAAQTNHGRQVVLAGTVTAPLLKVFVSNTTESGAVDQTQVTYRARFVGFA